MLLPRIERPVSKATDVGSLKLIRRDGGVVTDSNGTMVTIITEKLRSQTLDDNVQFAPIPQARRSWDLAPNRGSSRISHIKGEKDWCPYGQSSDHYRPAQSSDDQTTSLPPACPAACSSGDPRSHLQPSTPQKAAPPPAIATQLPPLTTASVTTTQQMMVVGKSLGLGGTTTVSSKTPPLMCFYNKSITHCAQSEFIPGTPPDPPKKRHCRSLSIPGDVKTVKCNSKSSKWQPQASSIWKPVALRPQHRHNSGKVHHHSGPAGLLKNRNSPVNMHSSKPPKLRAGGGNSPNCLAKGSNLNTTLGVSGNTTYTNQHTMVVASGSTSSSNSFSPAVHVFTGNDSSSCGYHGNNTVIVTPPESPAPRPASASSGFYDSSASQTSLTSLNISWTEGYFNNATSTTNTLGCFSPHPPPRSTSASSGQMHRHSDSFRWVRSVSVEDPIGFGEETLRADSRNSAVSPSGEGNRNHHRGGCLEASPRATRSMPMINLSVNATPRAVPWSPRRQRMPRCRSQPCVLTDRKAGLKRRRDEDRPSLNFNKMAETAYPPSVHQNRPKSVTFAQDIQESHGSRFGLYNELESFHVLAPIASSPLDPPQGFTLMAAAQVAKGDGNAVTPVSDRDNAKFNNIMPNPTRTISQTAKSNTLTIPVLGGAFRRENLKDLGIGGSRSGQLSLHQHNAEEIQWDSGCSDTNDPPDLIAFNEPSEDRYSFNDDSKTGHGVVAIDADTMEETQQFELEMGTELDLDQIEKD